MHKHASFSLFLSPWAALSKYLEMFAVYIDSLVMISIERSVTNKKKSTENPRQICHGLGHRLSIDPVRDRFVLDIQCFFFFYL